MPKAKPLPVPKSPYLRAMLYIQQDTEAAKSSSKHRKCPFAFENLSFSASKHPELYSKVVEEAKLHSVMMCEYPDRVNMTCIKNVQVFKDKSALQQHANVQRKWYAPHT